MRTRRLPRLGPPARGRSTCGRQIRIPQSQLGPRAILPTALRSGPVGHLSSLGGAIRLAVEPDPSRPAPLFLSGCNAHLRPSQLICICSPDLLSVAIAKQMALGAQLVSSGGTNIQFSWSLARRLSAVDQSGSTRAPWSFDASS